MQFKRAEEINKKAAIIQDKAAVLQNNAKNILFVVIVFACIAIGVIILEAFNII